MDREVKEPLIADLVEMLALQQKTAFNCPAGGGARAAKARGWPGASSGRSAGGGDGGRSAGGGGGGSGGADGPSGGGSGEGSSSAAASGSGSGGVSGRLSSMAIGRGRGGGGSSGSGGGVSGSGGSGGSGSGEKSSGFARLSGSVGGARRPTERDRYTEVMALPEKVGGYELIFPFNAATARLAGGVGGSEAQIVSEIKGELQAAQAAAQQGDVHAGSAQAPPPASSRAGTDNGPGREARSERSRDQIRGEGRGSADGERRRSSGSVHGQSQLNRNSGRAGAHLWQLGRSGYN